MGGWIPFLSIEPVVLLRFHSPLRCDSPFLQLHIQHRRPEVNRPFPFLPPIPSLEYHVRVEICEPGINTLSISLSVRACVRACVRVCVCVCVCVCARARACVRPSLSGTFLQTLPKLVTPLKGRSLSPHSHPLTLSAPSGRFQY